MSRGPLSGVRVLEIAAYTTGPFCTRLLANLGADVIKVEPVNGETLRRFVHRVAGSSYIFHFHNTNKRSIALDTGSADGKAVFEALAAKSDVLLENFAYGTMEGWGFGYSAMRAVNPGLVYCSCSGFGHTGPAKELRVFDTVIQGMAGVMSLTGTADGPPTKIGISAADAIGATASVMAINGALLHKRRTGKGQHINMSMHDVMGWLTAPFWPALGEESGPGRDGNHHPDLAPQNLYEAKDGAFVVEVETQEQLNALLALLGAAELAEGMTPESAKTVEPALDTALAGWARSRTVEAAVADLVAVGVPAAPVRNLPDIVDGPLARERDMVVDRTYHDGSPLTLLGSPYKFSGGEDDPVAVAPEPGQHSAEILREVLGYDASRIEALARDGVIGLGSS